MPERSHYSSLTDKEKRVIKALFNKGYSKKEIQRFFESNRQIVIDKKQLLAIRNDKILQATDNDELEYFQIVQRSYDPQTGLNKYCDERLIRAREAMTMAVQIFNSSTLKFKTEIFAVLANIAWTYLLHEYYDRQGVSIVSKSGRSILLSQMTKRSDCPLPTGVQNNIYALVEIRNAVEHRLFGRSDVYFQTIFQACCLNFNEYLCKFFGDSLSLANELSLVLFFSRMDIEQLATLNKYEIPANIRSLDKQLEEKLTDDQLNDLQYRFRVIYTLESTSKSKAHFKFINPDSEEGKEIRNVLIRDRFKDQYFPFKPTQVCEMVTKRTGQKFTMHNHTKAWKYFKVRPNTGNKQPENTDKDYCIYHSAYYSYTYSNKWVNHLVQTVENKEEFKELQATSI